MHLVYGMSETASSILSLVLWVLYIIAFWRTFNKFDEPGWKSIIPIYNMYVWWKYTWKKTGMFWLFLILTIVGEIFNGISSAAITVNGATSTAGANSVWTIIGSILLLAAFIIYVMQCLRAAKAFGKGTGFGIGLLLLSPIFIMILGYGSAEYVGAQD